MSVVKIKIWLAGLCMAGMGLALVGCGGGSGSGTPVLGGGSGGGGATAAKVEVSTSNATLGDGASTITVTAIVKDANNVGLPNTAVVWGATAGNLTGAALTTDVDGKAVATFSASDRSAGTATISATSGSANGSTVVALQSARTVVVSSSAPAVGTDGGTVTITAVVKDPNNVSISGASVSWKADIGSLTNQVSVTNAQGLATATYSPGSTVIQPNATITATSAGASSAVTVQVTPTTTSIELLAALPSIGTGGDQVQISAFVTDSNNVAKVGAPIRWSVVKGRISNQALVTDINGVARATLDAGSDKSNREAVVTASVTGTSAFKTLNVPIGNTRITYAGPTTSNVGSTVKLTFTAADSKQVAIGGAALTVTSVLGNGLAYLPTTDSAGQISVDYVASKPGVDTVTVAGLGTSQTVTMTVTGSDEDLAFIFPTPASKVLVGAPQTVTVRYRKSGVDQPGVQINLAATIGTLSSGSVTTGAGGLASATVTSGFAGSSMLSATLSASAVQATLPLSFIATVPATLVLQVTPTALAPNSGGATSQQATLVAKATDANGNPVSGSTINFSQLADPSGGLLQQASAVTDLNGVATVQYLSGAISTASGAVQLKAAVASNPAVSGTAVLTVNQSALFIALGTGNTITNFNPETYEKNWTVYVTDANGVRVTNVPVTVKVIPNYFAKGQMIWSELASQWVYLTYAECLNEDRANYNGRLDPGEDTNGDGSLTPGNVVFLGANTVTTDSNGSATITMRYAELYAPWIGVRLTATAIVAGTESTSFRDFPLDKLAGDFSVKTVAPAGARSPFGVDVTTCTNPN